MFRFIVLSVFIFCFQSSNPFIFLAVRHPFLSKFHRDRVHKVHLHADRSFHSLVTLQRLSMWGLGPKPSIEALVHKLIVRRCECLFFFFFFFFLVFRNFLSII